VFNTSSPFLAANLCFSILQLYRFWTGSSPNLERMFVGTMSLIAPALTPDVVPQLMNTPPLSFSIDDEDLLDY
jgi:hypothetical protein